MARACQPPQLLNARQIIQDCLAGTTVAMILVPEAVAFAFMAGLKPAVGLQVSSSQLSQLSQPACPSQPAKTSACPCQTAPPQLQLKLHRGCADH